MSFRVYKASAGSGKTFTLVKEYLKLVLHSPEKYRRILAVTFTNKAANEMKSRIVRALAELSTGEAGEQNQSPLLKALIAESNLDALQIRERSSRVLALIIHHYSDFSIGTIDSFVHRLVRTFAHDLRLPHQFEVELDSGVVVESAVGLLLDKVGTNDHITSSLLQFLLSRLDEEGNWKIENELVAFCERLLKEDGFDQMNKLELADVAMLKQSRDFLIEKVHGYRHELQLKSSTALALIAAAGLEPDDLAGGAKGIYSFFNKLKNGQIVEASTSARWRKVLESGDWCSSNAKKRPDAVSALDTIQDQLNKTLEDIAHSLDNNSQLYALRLELINHIHALAVMAELRFNMDEIRQEENLVHISEFNKRISGLIGSVAVPYIYERIGERFQHYLIDEFQDTSILQWHNFLPLFENALANQNLSMVVGDAKQAIYRFRSGEVEQFIQLPKVFRKERAAFLDAAENALDNHYDGRNLEANYRSDHAVVSFNNGFFDFVRQFLSPELQPAYNEQRQKIIRPEGSGYVEISFLEKEVGVPDADDAFLVKVYETVLKQMEDGYQPRQIAILTRTRRHGSLIARYMTEKGIGVVSDEALQLGTSSRVRILVNLFKLMQNADDSLALTMLVHDLATAFPGSFANWQQILEGLIELPAKQRFAKVNEILDRNGFQLQPAKLRNLGIYDQAESLVRVFGFDEQADPYVQFFLEKIHEFQINQRGSLAAFIDYWDEQKNSLSVIVPESTNSVRIMTIHKAKGLEFPVVIYPYADYSISKSTKQELWADLQPDEAGGLPVGIFKIKKDLQNTRLASYYEEEREKTRLDAINLLYVVLTRASRRLYILTENPQNEKGFKFNVFFKDYLNQLGLWNDHETVFAFGRPEDALPDHAKLPDEQPERLVSFISNDWKEKLYIAPDPVSQWSGKQQDDAAAWGLLVHELLSEIHAEQDAERVLEKYRNDGTLDAHLAARLQGLFSQLFGKAELKGCFDPGAINLSEHEIITEGGKVLRPDRCVLFADKVVVIDYKTGAFDTAHHKQLRLYKETIQTIEYKPIEAFLVYLDEGVEVIPCE